MSLDTLWRTGLAVLCALSLAAFAAFGYLALDPTLSSAAGGSSVSVRLADFRVTPSTRSVRHGKVTFNVSNRAMDEHELVVIRTAKSAAHLPISHSRASEAGRVGESGAIRMGGSKRFSLHLKPGHYALICNEPGHYGLGMHSDFTVS